MITKVIFLLFSSLCLAEFWEDEKLIQVLRTYTGYSLNEAENIAGRLLAYGFTDRLMMGINLEITEALISCIGPGCKYVIVKETNTLPAIALGASYLIALDAQLMADTVAGRYKEDVESIKAGLHSYLIMLGMSKRLRQKLVGHGSFNLAITDFKWEVKTKPGKSDPTSKEKERLKKAAPTTKLSLGMEYEHSKKLRLLSNLGFDFDRRNLFLGAGIIWALTRTIRIELGLYYPLYPHFDIYWRW